MHAPCTLKRSLLELSTSTTVPDTIGLEGPALRTKLSETGGRHRIVSWAVARTENGPALQRTEATLATVARQP